MVVWVFLLLLGAVEPVRIRSDYVEMVGVVNSYDIMDVNDSTLLILVDYHADVLQPATKHTRNPGFRSQHYAQLMISSRNVHRRLVELLARQFFPHRITTEKKEGFVEWRDNQTWRGRVIATREAFNDDSCAFRFQTRPIPKPIEFAYRRNMDLLLQLSTYSRFFKNVLPIKLDKDGRRLFPTSACEMSDLQEVGWPWVARSRGRISKASGVPPLQGEQGDSWLGNLPSLRTLLNKMSFGDADPSHPRNEGGTGHKSKVYLGGPHGIPHPRVLQAIRGRNSKLRAVSPFAMIAKDNDLRSYSAVYQYPKDLSSISARTERSGQSIASVLQICQQFQDYQRKYEVMHDCFATTGCPFDPLGYEDDCCAAQRKEWREAAALLQEPADGQSSLMETVVTHLCGFQHVEPLKVLIAGVGIPGVFGAAHDVAMLAFKLRRKVQVQVVEDLVVDYTLVNDVSTDEYQKLGDWAREWWSGWLSSCDMVGSLCKLGRQKFYDSPHICLQPPCYPKPL